MNERPYWIFVGVSEISTPGLPQNRGYQGLLLSFSILPHCTKLSYYTLILLDRFEIYNFFYLTMLKEWYFSDKKCKQFKFDLNRNELYSSEPCFEKLFFFRNRLFPLGDSVSYFIIFMSVCVLGYFCDNTMDIVVLDNDTTVCPVGHYCPTGKFYIIWLTSKASCRFCIMLARDKGYFMIFYEGKQYKWL